MVYSHDDAIDLISSTRVNKPPSNHQRVVLPKKQPHQNVKRQPTNIPYKLMTPIIDTKTSNQSFLNVHCQLKLLGIKNNDFFLLLLNPLLQGVNPHDPNISPELAMMVVEECRQNIWYYLREVVRIPEQGTGTVPFQLDRGTLAAAYCFIHDINFYITKPRQTGKSVGLCVLMSWAFKFGITNGGFAFYANTEKNCKANLKRMKTYISLLPSYMANMGTVVTDNTGKKKRKTNNIKSYEEPLTGNNATVMGCSISESVAEELGRGETHNFELYDEAEFISFIETIVQVSGMAFTKASENAQKNGMHSCRIFATTPGDLSDEKKCQSAMKIVNDALVWEESLYNIPVSEFKKKVATKSAYQVVYIEYSYRQLGLGEAWFRRACSNVGNNVNKIRREILLQRFSGNNQSPFSMEDITELDENIQHPHHTVEFGQRGLYKLQFYVPEEEIKTKRIYFIGLDPSDGTGSDYYGMTVVDPYTFDTIMEFKSQYMSPQGCKELLEYIMTKWFSRAILCVESNRNGLTIIDYFKESSIIRPRLYASSEATLEAVLAKDQYDDIGFLKDEMVRRKYFGIKTTSTSRDMMMGILTDSVRFRKDILKSENLVTDIKNLVLKNGVIKAASGKHDDCVMSWCIAMYTIYFGEKLERYGFRKGELPSDIEEDEEFIKLEKLYKDPIIRQQFPSMYSFYMNNLREKLKNEHIEKKSVTLQTVADSGMGSIVKDIIKTDPTYGKTSVASDTGADILLKKWQNMGSKNKTKNTFFV